MTKRLFVSAVAAVLALAAGPQGVDAHGYLMVPAAKLASSGDPTKYAATIYGPSALTAPAGMKFSDTIQNNLAAFTKAFKSAGWSSLASFIKKKAPSAGACGTTSLTPSSPKTVGDYVQWSSFAESHVGPCEVWCDSTRVFQNDNCAGAYKSAPAKLAINKSKCASAKQLTFYWLALHEIYWQVYINCVSLKGAESRSIEDDSDDDTDDNYDTDDNEDNETTDAEDQTEVRTNDDDCDEDLPEPSADEDCDNDLPEPDCDDDLPEPDCDDDLPEPNDSAAGDADGDDTPVTATPTKTTPSKPSTPSVNTTPSPTVTPSPTKKTPSTPTTKNPSSGTTTPATPNTGGETGGDADCDQDLPEPSADEDCDQDLPEPDCDDDLPEPSDSEDCDKDLPEPTTATSTSGETGGESDSYNFDALQRGAKYTPGKAEADDY